MRFFEYIKNIFFILIILQLAPALVRGVFTQYQRYWEPRTKIGVVPILGSITKAHPFTKNLYAFFKDPEIKGIVLKLDCNGGTAGSCEHIFNDILALKKQYPKPVVALIENVCTSGGYWIACASDYIIAPRAAVIGSIGAAFSNLFQLRSFLETHQVKCESLTAGKYKNATDPFVDLTPESKEMLQNVLESTYQTFVSSVAAQRKLSLNDADTWAEATLFSGAQAQEKGLVDELGGSQAAINALRDRAIIEGEIDWVYPESSQSFLQKMWSPQEERDGSSLSTRLLDGFFSYLEMRYTRKTEV